VRRGDRDPTLFLLRRLVNLIKGNKIRHPLQTAQLRDRCRQRRLAMVNVTDRPYVYVRLRPLKFCFAILKPPMKSKQLFWLISTELTPSVASFKKGGAHDRN
jgi:hypothetical protein